MKTRALPPVSAWNIEQRGQFIGIGTIYLGQRLYHRYIGYSKKRAMQLFRQYLREQSI